MRLTTILLILFPLHIASHAQNIEQKVYAPDASSEDNFGYSVSLYEDYAIIGAKEAYNEISDAIYAGVAYIFKKVEGQWVFHQKIAEPDIELYDDFGFAVEISENYAAIGAPLTYHGGSVFVYKRNGDQWERQLKLPEYYRSDFGSSVSIDNDYIVVGAPDSNGWGPDWSRQGAAWIFNKSDNEGDESWVEVSMIAAGDGYRNGHFGYDVDISGDYIIAGAWTASSDYFGRSAAYIFENENGDWIEKQRLLPADTDTTINHFGISVSISGETAAVGAPEEINEKAVKGAVYIFERDNDGWKETAKLLSPEPDTSIYGEFGRSVDLQDHRILVGAYNSVLIYELKDKAWQLTDSIHHDYYNNGQAYHNFGTSIALSDSTFLVGAYDDCDQGSIAGAAHFYYMSFSTPSNISPENTQDSLVVFPNPVNSTLKIKDTQGIKQIIIYNSSGIRMRTLDNSQSNICNEEIDFSVFKSGLYIVSIVDQKNDYKSIKVIKN